MAGLSCANHVACHAKIRPRDWRMCASSAIRTKTKAKFLGVMASGILNLESKGKSAGVVGGWSGLIFLLVIRSVQ